MRYVIVPVQAIHRDEDSVLCICSQRQGRYIACLGWEEEVSASFGRLTDGLTIQSVGRALQSAGVANDARHGTQ